METSSCIVGRRSIRRFKEKTVELDLIKDLIELASFAPSWKNSQTTRYIAILNSEIKESIAKECCENHNRKIIESAPLLVATTIVDKRSGFERDGSFSTIRENLWQAFDHGIAAQTFCLAAHDMDLGTVIIGLYDIEKASKILEVPEGELLMSIIAVGYPDEEPAAPKRKAVDQLLTIKM